MKILGGIVVGMLLLAVAIPAGALVFIIFALAGVAAMIEKGVKYEVTKSRTVDETDEKGIVWSTTRTETKKVWVDGELVVNETRTVEE